MDKNAFEIIEKRIARTVRALRENNFDAHYVKDKEELFKKLGELMPDGITCSSGGSMTILETGVADFLRGGKYNYLDRAAKGADMQKIQREAFSCDVYLTSSNAITEDGELYNMDGYGNRVAALIYGPKKVIVIAGANKIVKNLDAAHARIKEVAAPSNGVRLGRDTPCVKTGVCADCKTPERLCCHEVVSHYQQDKNRITVLILPESYGY